MSRPPTLRLLLEDPIYRRMFTKAPVPVACQLVPGARPWAVYARIVVETAEGDVQVRWRSGMYRTYADAFHIVRDALKARDDAGGWKYDDVALVSRAVLYGPPPGLQWFSYPGGYNMSWCGRCRRPSNFLIRHKHHALKNAPVLTNDEPRVCFYCGMRQVAMPRYRPIPMTG